MLATKHINTMDEISFFSEFFSESPTTPSIEFSDSEIHSVFFPEKLKPQQPVDQSISKDCRKRKKSYDTVFPSRKKELKDSPKENELLTPLAEKIDIFSGLNKMDMNGICNPVDHCLELLQRFLKGEVPILPPQEFLKQIMASRGYVQTANPTTKSDSPSPKQLQDYGTDILNIIRNSDLRKLKRWHHQGFSLSACNKYGESIIHLACRRSDYRIVDYLSNNLADFSLVDDYGRNVLHDACWREVPDFGIVTLLLDKNNGLLSMQDVRGALPLEYVRRENWLIWCVYLYRQRDRYWKPAV